MKSLIGAVLGLGLVIIVLACLNRTTVTPPAPVEPAAEPVSARAHEIPLKVESQRAARGPLPIAATPSVPARRSVEVGAAPAKAGLETTMLNQAVNILVSPQATYNQKQEAWKQLSDGGKLDQAITELEQRMAADPNVAEYPATLGQAYLKKCATLQDVREQGILGMQADKLFDSALNLDPSNWEARFTKAIALSFWPANMNKGNEVIQQFQVLIQQQEAQVPQPQFAESYVWLGDQYLKSGHGDYAQTIWERGAGLFPNHEGLKNKLAAVNPTPGAGPVSTQQ